MITLLGKIDIPDTLLEDVKTREPDRVVSHVSGKSHKQNLEELDKNKFNIENYKHYDNDRCLIKEYCKSWYKDIVPTDLLEQHNLNSPKNAIVLKVEPGTFSVPHQDKFNHALRDNPEIEFDDIVRLWIPLENSTFGQALFVENEVLHKYKAGEVYNFGNYDFHSAANAGLDTRYTLIVYTTKK